MGVNHALEVIDIAVRIILDDMVMDGTSSTLNGRVRTEVEVVLKWMSDIALNKSARKRVVVLVRSAGITIFGEEANVMALAANTLTN